MKSFIGNVEDIEISGVDLLGVSPKAVDSQEVVGLTFSTDIGILDVRVGPHLDLTIEEIQDVSSWSLKLRPSGQVEISPDNG